jgi:hypothetical protein
MFAEADFSSRAAPKTVRNIFDRTNWARSL